MAIVIKVNGAVKSGNLLDGSTSINSQLNSITTCSFTMFERDVAVATGVVVNGNEIIIEDDGVRVFGGVAKVVRREQRNNESLFYYYVEAYCFGSYLNHHVVAKVYENQLAGDIIKDIFDDHLTTEGFTYASVEDGPTITKAVFNYGTVTAAIDEICELTGFSYYVDHFKDIHFFSREANAAPFTITDAAKNCRSLVVTDTHENYRNTQYLRAGHDETESQIELFSGDSKRISFTLTYPVAKLPVVKVDTVAKTIGILGLETGFDFYWSKGQKEITQDPGGTVLTSSNELEVTYTGLFPLIIKAEDPAKIADRKAVENGHGVYEHVSDNPNIDNLQSAIEKANGMLRLYGIIQRKINITTDVAGLKAGQLLTINLTAEGINDEFLIEDVTSIDEKGYGFRHSATALSGETFGGWLDFFKKLILSGRKYVIRENEVLTLLQSYSDSIDLTDSLATSTATPDFIIGVAEIGYSEIQS